MNTVQVCVPVLKRYDLLKNLVESLIRSTVPVKLYVMDNGRRGEKLMKALGQTGIEFEGYTPVENMGVAASWNWFLRNVKEPRVIANDDVTFAPHSLEVLTSVPLDLAWACGFSCFLIDDACVDKVGYFDETISPGYAYYEDDDYLQRLDGRGTREAVVRAGNVACGVAHVSSATLKVATPEEMEEHHRKFKIAQGNYARKWGLEEAFERERMQRELVRR